MSSFDQSRGFHVPSTFARQESYSSTADPWGSPAAAPPPAAPLADDHLPPSLSGFAGNNAEGNTTQRLDYSVIDEEDAQGVGAGPGGGGGARGAHGGFGDNLLDGQGRDGPWQLPRQQRIELVLQGDLEGWMVKHHVYSVIQPDVRPLLSLPLAASGPLT